VDASFVIEANSTLSIITDKDEEGLEVIRLLRFCLTSLFIFFSILAKSPSEKPSLYAKS
jgi:hypothetical protein